MVTKYKMKVIFIYLILILVLFEIRSDEDILNMGIIYTLQTIDPMFVTTSGEFDTAIQLFEGLTVFDPNDLSPKPGAAKEWEITADGIKYTFFLRKGAKWSDGTPISAYDFEYSLFRVLDSKNDPPYIYLLYYIKNAKSYHEGNSPKSDVGIKVLNEYTLEIILESPASFFLGLTMLPIFMPVPKHVISKYGNKWTDTKNIVNNGPFRIIDGDLKNSVNLEKNDYYWDKDIVKLKRINMLFFNTDDEIYNKYKFGEIQFATGLTSTKISEIINNPDVVRFPLLATYFYRLNVKNPVLSDVRVRKALYLSINRNYICRKVLQGGEIPAYGFIPERMPGYKNFPGEREDPGKARKLLEEAGYPEGKNFPKLKILFNDQNEHKIVAKEIQKMWKQELNINVELDEQEYDKYRKRLFNLEYDIARSSWVGDYIDPSTFLDIFENEYGRNNRTGWFNKDYTGLLHKARKQIDIRARNDAYYEAEKILINEVPIIPIKNSISIYLLNKRIKGIYPNVMDLHPLKEVYYVK